MTSWRLLESGPHDGALNMAVDVALMERARLTGETVLRTYSWASPTLSLGRNQRARGRYDRAALEDRAVAVVRRPTGGRAILHWRELTYSVTAPCASRASAAGMYEAINAMLLEALHRLGIDAQLASRSRRERQPDEHPCFAEPSAGEIVVRTADGPGKLVGSAQYLEDGALLQHGSILLHDDQPLLRELTGGDTARTSAASVADALGRDAAPDEVAQALADAVSLGTGAPTETLDWDEMRAAAGEHVEKFRDPLWTWRL